jgi:hypothetical protein
MGIVLNTIQEKVAANKRQAKIAQAKKMLKKQASPFIQGVKVQNPVRAALSHGAAGALAGGLGGAAVGGIGGAIGADEGDRMEGALRGARTGALTGATLGGIGGAATPSLLAKGLSTMFNPEGNARTVRLAKFIANHPKKSLVLGGLAAAGTAAAPAALGYRAGKTKKPAEPKSEPTEEKKEESSKAAGVKLHKKAKSILVKQAMRKSALGMHNLVLAPLGAVGGGIGGGLIGAAGGAIGAEEGNRWEGAMRGARSGALTGAAIGGVRGLTLPSTPVLNALHSAVGGTAALAAPAAMGYRAGKNKPAAPAPETAEPKTEEKKD